MRTLYISDLDGTLLSPQSVLTPFAEETLGRCIAGGMVFGIATARTAATVLPIFANVPLNGPVILMNGGAVYDAGQKKYIHLQTMAPDDFCAVQTLFAGQNIHPFFYTVQHEQVVSFYEALDNAYARAFYEERKQKYHKDYRVFSSLLPTDFPAIQITALDRYEALLPIWQHIQKMPGLRAEFYRDVYIQELWYLEVASARSGKKAAVEFLRRHYGFTQIVAFGDNKNDLPLFEAADRCYAVKNARPEVLAAADGVLGANTEDAVPKFLWQQLCFFGG